MVTLKLTATLKDQSGTPLSAKPIDFSYSYDGSTYTPIQTLNTNENGVAETQHETDKTTWYKARFEGDDTYDASEATQTYEFPTAMEQMVNQMMTLISSLFPLMIMMMMLSMMAGVRRRE